MKSVSLDKSELSSDEQELYRENILDHYKHPRHYTVLPSFTHTHRELNPLCGDELEVYLNVKQGRVENISFQGKGCAISQAAMSLLTDAMLGKRFEEVMRLSKEAIFSLLGIPISSVRTKCALLSLKTVQMALGGTNE